MEFEAEVDRVTNRLAKLNPMEVEAVMQEAAKQYHNRSDDSSRITDYIENGLDMLASGEYKAVIVQGACILVFAK